MWVEQVANIEYGCTELARLKVSTLMAEVEGAQLDPHVALEQIHSFLSDLRAFVGCAEGVYILDMTTITHPHGMAENVRMQRNNLLSIPRKLMRAEVINRWESLVNRWPTFLESLDAKTQP